MPKKVCTVCELVLEIENFPKRKAICKTCYNQINKEKYEKRQKLLKEKKELEIKAQAVQEYEAMQEENRMLKEKLALMEKDIAIQRVIDSGEYDKLVENYKKCKEILDGVQLSMRKYVNT